MTDGPASPARARFRIFGIIAAAIIAGLGALVAWTIEGGLGGCALETPAVFSRLYHISSAAMKPGIEPGDWVWAERRYYCSRDPERGDLAVLALASQPGTAFVMRVIGLPGDRVQLQRGQLLLNGEPVRRDWLESTMHASEAGEETHRTRFTETLPNGTRYEAIVGDPDAPLENTGEIAVPEGRYFVLGDNRGDSEDSRAADFGLVPRGAIADRPVRVVWSSDRSRIGSRLGAPP